MWNTQYRAQEKDREYLQSGNIQQKCDSQRDLRKVRVDCEHDMLLFQELASPETAMKHFRSLPILCHLDLGGSEESFKVLQRVKKVLEAKA